MSKLYNSTYQFGAFVERRKFVLVSCLLLALPITAIFLSWLAPSIGQWLFSPVCHQNSDRCFHLAAPLPLCARCFGLYLGFGLAGLFAPAFSFRFSKRFLIAAIFASVVTTIFGHFVFALDDNYVRLLLGLSVGAGFALLIKSVLK